MLYNLRVKKIIKLDYTRRVYDLVVPKNSNFFIKTNESVLLTHNCDYITPEAQAALRNTMEQYSNNTRFILTSNYIDKISKPIISRTQVFELTPPTKKEVAAHLIYILTEEKVAYSNSAIATLINAYYPDIRRIIGAAQQCTINGVLEVDMEQLASTNYDTKILEVLAGNKSAKTRVDEIRKVVADNNIKDFNTLYRLLYDRVEEYAGTNIAHAIIQIAEGQYKDTFVPDKEVNFAATIFNILS